MKRNMCAMNLMCCVARTVDGLKSGELDLEELRHQAGTGRSSAHAPPSMYSSETDLSTLPVSPSFEIPCIVLVRPCLQDHPAFGSTTLTCTAVDGGCIQCCHT